MYTLLQGCRNSPVHTLLEVSASTLVIRRRDNMKIKYVFEEFYHNVAKRAHNVDHIFYSRRSLNELVQYVIGNELLALGIFNTSVENEQDTQYLQDLYRRIILSLVEDKDTERAKLYLLRGEASVGDQLAAELEESIKNLEFDRAAAEKGYSYLYKAPWYASYEALGYAYRLDAWVRDKFTKDGENHATAWLEQIEEHSIFIDQELRFLANIPDIPNICEKNNSKFYLLAFNICKDLADIYEDIDKKEKSVETLNLAKNFSERYKEYNNWGIRGSVPAARKMKQLTREINWQKTIESVQ